MSEDILKQYENSSIIFSEFKSKLDSLIIELLKEEKINAHLIASRVKSQNSLKRKIENKLNKYNSLNEITDCVGIRIITFMEDEVDLVAKIIEAEFEIDFKNSIDKRKLEVDRFGYKSLHYVISLTDERLKLKEYSRFKKIKAEVQIRSILQHSWAEIEHDLGYKNEITIPEFIRRDFYRVAALLETADLEFVKIKTALRQYDEKIEKEIITHPENFNINKNTLESFVDKSEHVHYINTEISKILDLPINSNYGNFDYVILILNKYNISTIEQLNSRIISSKEMIIKFETECVLKEGLEYTAMGKAIAIHGLAALILVENNDPDNYPQDDMIPFEDAYAIYQRLIEKN
jgi:putative GTP pyrophosphokinase